MRRLRAALDLALPLASAHPGLLVGVAAALLLATTVFVGGPMYAEAVTRAGLQEELRTLPVERAGLRIAAQVAPDDADDLDASVDAEIATLGAGRAVTHRQLRSGSLSRAEDTGPDELFVLSELPADAGAIEVVDGRAPGVGEVLLHVGAASVVGVDIGDSLPLELRTSGTRTAVRVSGTYRLDAGGRWWADTLTAEGVEVGTGFTTWNLLVPRGAIGELLPRERLFATWQARLVAGAVVPSDLASLEAASTRMIERVRDLPAATDVQVVSQLPDQLRVAREALAATRATVVSVTTPLALLAILTLVLAAGLLVEVRDPFVALAQARGASPAQLGGAAALEATTLVLPVLVAAPWLAQAAVSASDAIGPVAAAGLQLTPRVDLGAYRWAALAAAIGWIATVTPGLRASRTFVEARAQRGREDLRSRIERWGVDVGLVLLALLGLWQLRRYAGSTSAGGRQVDPIVVLAPPVAIAAVTLLTVRALPALGRLLVRGAAQRPRVAALLAGAQTGRRPRRTRRAGLTLLLGAALTVYAVGYASTWSRSQTDRADLAVGADVSIAPVGSRTDAPPASTLGAIARTQDGVVAATPVLSRSVPISAVRRAGEVVGVGPEAAETLLIRPDLVTSGAGDADALLSSLATGRDAVPSLPLPPDTTSVEVTVRATGQDVTGEPRLRLTIVDGDGLFHRHSTLLPLGTGDATTVAFSLGAGTPPTPPLALAGLEVVATAPVAGVSGTLEVRFEQVTARATGGTSRAIDTDAPWELAPPRSRVMSMQPTGSVEVAAQPRLTLTSGVAARVEASLAWRLVPGPIEAAGTPVRGILTDEVAEALEVGVGDEVGFADGGRRLTVLVVGTLTHIPTRPDEPLAVLVDGPTLAARHYARDGRVLSPDRWLVATDDDAASTVVDALQRAALGAEIRSAEGVARDLRRDPVRLGLAGALVNGAWAALAVTAVALLVDALVAGRRRRRDVALLRGLGLPARTLRSSLAIEVGTTVGLSVIVGAILGIAAIAVVLPAIGLTRAGTVAIPATVLVVPVGALGLVVAAGLAATLVVPWLVARRMLRADVAAELRAGDEP